MQVSQITLLLSQLELHPVLQSCEVSLTSVTFHVLFNIYLYIFTYIYTYIYSTYIYIFNMCVWLFMCGGDDDVLFQQMGSGSCILCTRGPQVYSHCYELLLHAQKLVRALIILIFLKFGYYTPNLRSALMCFLILNVKGLSNL